MTTSELEKTRTQIINAVGLS